MSRIVLKTDDIYKGALILVNADHPVSPNKNKQFVPLDISGPGVRLAQKAAVILTHILMDIGCGGRIVPVSGYRSRLEQEKIYFESLRDSGLDFTKKYVALPGHSEHPTGLAIDLGLKKDRIDFIRPEFPYKGICGVFRQSASRYGFIERYQKDKETITGISHEPWHFRYVGYPHSEIMQDYGLSLEEYVDFLKQFPYGGKHLTIKSRGQQVEIYYVPVPDNRRTAIYLPDNAICEVSGNNVDGCIVTEWRLGL